MTRRQIARVIINVVGAIGAVGLAVFAVVPADTPNLNAPCVGDVCMMCLAPSATECQRLTQCGGEPCGADEDGVDLYAGAAGRLARTLRELRARGAIDTWHTDVVAVDAGTVTDCATVVYGSKDQRAAWRRTIDAAGIASDVVDCRVSTMPAKFRANGGRRSTLAGVPPDTSSLETVPDDVVGSLDAGVE